MTTTKAPEVKQVSQSRIACDGGDGGHPRVWLQIPASQGWVECPYCDCRYELEEGATAAH